MAETTLSISALVPRESMLFRSLREKGIDEISRSASQTWTDHNVHDFGITCLEAFCFIITEAGNQLNFAFRDLIATPKGIADANINYPSAATNLPSKAITITDFRKIILDLPEIRNAYFETTRESKVPVFYDEFKNLTYDSSIAVAPVLWGGLYSIQLEMEDDDLNSITFDETVVVTLGLATKNVDVVFSFKYWDEVTGEWFQANTITSIVLEDTIIELDNTQYEDYYSEWTVNFSDGTTVTDFAVWVKLVEPMDNTDPFHPNVPAALQAALSSIAAGSPFSKYKANLVTIKQIIDKAHVVFNANRNLGEDLSFFTAIRLQEIAMDATVEIVPTADPVEVYAQIIFAIETFFSPRPHFKSLSELLADDDFKVENVFLGPMLDSGFLSEESLNTLSRGDTIYVSDLVHLILDISDTATVRDISLSTFFNNLQAIVKERNCLKVKKGYKPKLDLVRTKLVLSRNGVPVVIDQTLVDVRLTVLRANAAAAPSPGAKDLNVPFGDLPPFGEYRSVQYELPAIYGTGSAGISLSSRPERYAQLKQLQGYLFLFDQLLANTFAQLSNVGDLFAVHQARAKTYYSQTLYNVPGAEDLLGHLSGADPWEAFIAAAKNLYTQLLDDAGEPGDTFFQRRNIILDYLLARTAENRQDYSAILSTVPGNFSKQIILHEKENFLEKYPALSMARAQAYNYKLNSGGLPDVWDSENVGGYVKMVCAKLGFISAKERTLFHNITENFQFFNPPGTRKYKMVDNGGVDLMVGDDTYVNDAAATEAIKVFLQIGRYRENYEIIELSPGNFTFKIVFGIVKMAYSGAALATEAAAENVIKLIITIIGEKYTLEGIHVVEHILLRPRLKNPLDSDKLFSPLTAEETLLTEPYSHVVTAILPSGMERDFSIVVNPTTTPSVTGHRMRDPAFRLLAQQVILREAPAHLLVNIFFLDFDTDPLEALVDDRPSLQNFERKLKTWREAVANPASTDAVKISAQQKLVTVIEKIYSA